MKKKQACATPSDQSAQSSRLGGRAFILETKSLSLSLSPPFPIRHRSPVYEQAENGDANTEVEVVQLSGFTQDGDERDGDQEEGGDLIPQPQLPAGEGGFSRLHGTHEFDLGVDLVTYEHHE